MGICTERLRKEDPELVWVSHDESIFYSNGDWGKDGDLKSTPTYTRRKWKVYHGFRLYLFLSWDAYVG